MLRSFPALVVLVAVVGLAGCGQKTETSSTSATDSTITAAPPASTTPDPNATDTAGGTALNTMPVVPATPPDHIEVQHILIGFQGSIPNKPVTRTKAEAEKLAQDLLARARNGENMDALVQQYTDDQFPGVYGLANDGVTPDPARQEIARSGMVKGFSDASFGLSVGNVGISNYDTNSSPYGWHIIKRLK
jgi:PPIC-type PPIASE domain